MELPPTGTKDWYWNYGVKLLFISRDSPYDEEIWISEGSRFSDDVAGERDLGRLALDNLPRIGEIVTVPGIHSYWTVACVLRYIDDASAALSLAYDVLEAWQGRPMLFGATLLLIDQNVPLDRERTCIYVGVEERLVGIIGPDRVFRVLQPAGGADFTWGYSGEGPRTLAASILSHHLGYQPEREIAEAYSRDKLQHIPRGQPFVIRSKEIDEWLRSQVH